MLQRCLQSLLAEQPRTRRPCPASPSVEAEPPNAINGTSSSWENPRAFTIKYIPYFPHHSAASAGVFPQPRQGGRSLLQEHTRIFPVRHKINWKVFHSVFRLLLLTGVMPAPKSTSARDPPAQQLGSEYHSLALAKSYSYSPALCLLAKSSRDCVFFLLCSVDFLRRLCSSKTLVIGMGLAHLTYEISDSGVISLTSCTAVFLLPD